jgi:hypothetical protein
MKDLIEEYEAELEELYAEEQCSPDSVQEISDKDLNERRQEVKDRIEVLLYALKYHNQEDGGSSK